MRFGGIDGLRAFAVVAVIAAHSHVPWLHGGGVGVDIFFGISGFLITYLLIKESQQHGRVALGKFWLRRLLRLMPALTALVIFVDALAILTSFVRPNDGLADSLWATPSVLFYFSNWMIVGTSTPYLGWFGPLWSLSVEEQFYLVWPLVVVVVMRLRRPLLALAFIASAISLVAIVNRFVIFDGTNMFRTFGTDFRVDMLLAGALLAIAIHAGHTKAVKAASRALIAPAVLYLSVVAVIVPDFNSDGVQFANRLYYTVGLPFVALSTVAIIGFVVTHQDGKMTQVLSSRVLEYTGRISYGMYLWHYAVIMAVNVAVDVDPNLVFAISLLGTYAAAGVSWRFLEGPLQKRFHERLKPARAEPIRPVVNRAATDAAVE
ncbi:acyltransferase [Rhodococcus sp. WS4]|nr:acyltransferase [Rhodococcus sp. WS4]